MINLVSRALLFPTLILGWGLSFSFCFATNLPIRLMPDTTQESEEKDLDPSTKSLSPYKKKAKLPKDQYIQRGLDKIQFPLSSPVLTEVLQRLVLENVSPEDPVYLKGKKLDILYKLGRLQAFIRHLEALPPSTQSNLLRQHAFLALCFQPKISPEQMRQMASSAYAQNPSPFWRQATIFAESLTQNPIKAELALGVMRDSLSQEDAQFLKLMDHFLYGLNLEALKKPTLMELAIARQSKTPFSRVTLDLNSPPALIACVQSENLPPALRIEAAEKALDQGCIEPELLGHLYEKAEFQGEQIVDIQKNPEQFPQNLSPSLRRALLYQAAKNSAGQRRAEILHTFWKQNQGISFASLAGASYGLLKNLVPDEDLAWFAPDAFKAMILFTQDAHTHTWMALAQGESPELYLSASPYMYLSENKPQEPVDEWFQRWYHVKVTWDPILAKEKALLLANLLNAVGCPVHKKTLRTLEITYNRDAHPGILEAMYSKSLEGKSVEEVVVSACKKMSKAKSHKDWIRLSQAVSKLRQFGLKRESTRLALEIALKNGL